MTIQEFKKKISSPIIWGNILAMFLVSILLLFGLWFGFDAYTHHGEKIVVPDVTGMMDADAVYALEHAGLNPVLEDSGYNSAKATGCILDQQPVGGTIVKGGREIHLTVNSGSCPTLKIPDIADNCSLREAEARLRGLGFKIGPTEYTFGQKDWVIEVKCRGRLVHVGEHVPKDAPIILVVGDGTEEEDNFGDSIDTDDVSEEQMIF